jgi:hypothetical protein
MRDVPLPFGPLFGIALGALFAWVARAELGREERPLVTTPAFSTVCAFATMVYTPIHGYFVALHGDWAWLYLAPSTRVPSAVELALVLLAGASIPASFAATAPLAIARHATRLVTVASIPLGVMLVLAFAFARRLALSGSYAQVHGGFGTEPIGSSALGRGVAIAGIAIAVGVAWALRRLRTS